MASAQTSILGGRQPRYILGHDRDELDRLIAQARFFGDLTEEVLRRAGMEPGMRVLDVGCGTGDVLFLAARLSGRPARCSASTGRPRRSRWPSGGPATPASATSPSSSRSCPRSP
jgi:SAM-dependent methyltransferase